MNLYIYIQFSLPRMFLNLITSELWLIWLILLSVCMRLWPSYYKSPVKNQKGANTTGFVYSDNALLALNADKIERKRELLHFFLRLLKYSLKSDLNLSVEIDLISFSDKDFKYEPMSSSILSQNKEEGSNTSSIFHVCLLSNPIILNLTSNRRDFCDMVSFYRLLWVPN